MAKIRAVIIEGEMSPSELKEYVDAFWRGDSTLTRVAAQADMVPDAPKAPAKKREEVPALEVPPAFSIPVVAAPEPAPEPVAVVVEAPPAPAPVSASGRVEQIASQRKLSSVLQFLKDEGHVTLEAVIEQCKPLRDVVPVLQRLGEGLEDRITRTWEGMK